MATYQKAKAESYIEKLEESLPDEVAVLGDSGSTTDIASGLGKIFKAAFSDVEDIVLSSVKNGVMLISVSIFSSLSTGLMGSGKEKYVTLAGVAAVLSIAVSGAGSLIGGVSELVEELYAFSNTLLPTLASAEAAMGYTSSASAKLCAGALFMDVLVVAEKKIIIPLIYMYVALSAAGCVLGGGVKSVSKLVKWIINTLLVLITTTFTAYLTVTGLVASSADALTVKATKTVISTILPVVGKLASDASDSIASGFSVIKNTAGIMGILAICAVTAKPVIKLLSSFFVFKASGAISEAIAGKELGELIGDIGTALGLTIAVVGSCAGMLFIAVVASLKAAGGG